MVIGYIRACRRHPDVNAQADELFGCGAEKIYLDDGTSDALGDAFNCLRQGDMLLAVSLAVFAPSRPAAYALADRVASTRACLATLEEGIDTESRNGPPFVRFLSALRKLEANPEAVGPPEPGPLPEGSREAPEYVPDWEDPEPAGSMPEYVYARSPRCVPDANPVRTVPDWVAHAMARAIHAGPERPPRAPIWVREPVASPCPVGNAALPERPAWFPPAARFHDFDVRDFRPGPAPAPCWLPGTAAREAACGQDAAWTPAWIPAPAKRPDAAGTDPAPSPDWLPWAPLYGSVKYRRITRLYTVDRREWLPDPPLDMPRIPRRRTVPMPDPPGFEVPPCPDPDRIGTLPPDAKLKPGTKPEAADGTELIVIPSKPGAEKAISEGVTDVARASAEKPRTAAERLVIAQMREQRKLAGIRHTVIAAVIALLILLGILAAALPKLNAGRGILGEAPAGIPGIEAAEGIPLDAVPEDAGKHMGP